MYLDDVLVSNLFSCLLDMGANVISIEDNHEYDKFGGQFNIFVEFFLFVQSVEGSFRASHWLKLVDFFDEVPI